MTNEIKHHLTDALLMGYASGNLPEAFDLVVATHISLCDECRARLGSFEAVGGALIDEAADAVDVNDDALESTLRLIEGAPKDPIRIRDTAPEAETVFPEPLRDYVGGDLDAVRWRSIAGGVKQAVLPTSRDATVRLLAIPGGAAMPDHGHHGTELTLVLKGAFRDDDGLFARGDVEVANEDLHHTPIAEPGEVCICLAATDAPLRFKGILPRIAQRFIGI
ncbi:transcriptional regulator [Alphaproteobacteria bacterium GH1-50]|uniref:Transcriptional regulator n=1 Tax=Kangsaoukella pontilimi TaxID=2691042 RepID=A0A7C9IG78_9RHOB|nr:ChrR family anti-sigma-E factor [Kangsaoukella pontilimi]MXQ08144.1 transcriptional regulator [Kangsaoukella pontilimi]